MDRPDAAPASMPKMRFVELEVVPAQHRNGLLLEGPRAIVLSPLVQGLAPLAMN